MGLIMRNRLLKVEQLERRELLTTTFTFKLASDYSTHGYTDEQVVSSIEKAFEDYYESNADVDLRIDPNGQYTIGSGVLYLGNSRHARGQTYYPDTILIHSGDIPVGTHPDAPFKWKAFANEQAITSIVAHEIGHLLFFGSNHSSDTDCLMHINASADDLCESEKRSLVRNYGSPPNPPPEVANDSAIIDWYIDEEVIDVLANDRDPNNDPLILESVETDGSGEASIRDNKIVYTPNPGVSGDATIWYYVTDGDNSVRGQVSITINKVEYPWSNPTLSQDVNDDGKVTALDALLVINRLNRSDKGVQIWIKPDAFYDVNDDEELTALDALLVINLLNSG